MIYTIGIYHPPKEADHDCHRQIVHAWPQPSGAAAQGIPLRGHRGADQQGRQQGDSGASHKEAVRRGGVARKPGSISAQVWAKIDALRNDGDLFSEGGFDDPPEGINKQTKGGGS
jgi:hypothetical protein